MGRPKKQIEVPAETEESVEVVEPVEEPKEDVVESEEPTPKQIEESIEEDDDSVAISWDVLKSGVYVRSYSIEVHGVDAKELAEQFATKVGGEVKVS